MFSSIRNVFRLTKAGIILAWHGAVYAPGDVPLPGPLRAVRKVRGDQHSNAISGETGQPERLARAIRSLGPTYIKLGQFLATRPDVAGPHLATALTPLRDRLPPFPLDKAKAEIEAAFKTPWSSIYITLSEPVAAASIAQVHKAIVFEKGRERAVAVKILRPDIERRFARDLDSFYFAARTLERFSSKARRLRPIAAVDTLAASVILEMDLRLEAAAISEMHENITKANDTGFRVPKVDWQRTTRRVLTIEWIDAIPIADLAAIDRAGIDRETLGLNVIRSFLRHAIRDGFFHADMHQGNLFVDSTDGTVIAVDFGIMGRIGVKERRFLAEILYGFLQKTNTFCWVVTTR